METADNIRLSFWPGVFTVLMFFFNHFTGFEGLTFSLLLLPVWVYVWYRSGCFHWRAWSVVVLFLSGYAVIHLLHGIHGWYYFRSSVLLLSTLLFVAAVCAAFRVPSFPVDALFRQLLILNFFLVLFALIALLIPSLKNVVWYTISISKNIEPFPRLKMFTEEASHYSFLWALPAIYFLSKLAVFKVRRPALLFVMILLPLLLSFSLGVLTVLGFSALVATLQFRRQIFRTSHSLKMLLLLVSACVLFLFVIYLVYPGNPLFVRLHNVFAGHDTSANGRTYQSFLLAHKIIAQKSLLFGIGPGQLKVDGRNIIIQYYAYTHMPEVVRIPNACADTMVCFGYTGLVLRIALQIVLFFTSRVPGSIFRFWLFVFLFIYQFTGSYLGNVDEYLLWAICFSPMFDQEFLYQATVRKKIQSGP